MPAINTTDSETIQPNKENSDAHIDVDIELLNNDDSSTTTSTAESAITNTTGGTLVTTNTTTLAITNTAELSECAVEIAMYSICNGDPSKKIH